MNAVPETSRKLVYALLITVAAGIAAGRIMVAERVLEPSLHKAKPTDKIGRIWSEKRPRPMPTFSSNDISRWAMIRALVDDGTFVIGKRDKTKVLAQLRMAWRPTSPPLPLTRQCSTLCHQSMRWRQRPLLEQHMNVPLMLATLSGLSIQSSTVSPGMVEVTHLAGAALLTKALTPCNDGFMRHNNGCH